MSTDTPTDHQRPPDPHGIIPDEFWLHFDSLEAAERAPSTSDRADEKRCPECESARIREKQDRFREQPNRRAEDWKCQNCGCHFSTPLPSKNDALPGEQVELGGFGNGD